MESRPECRLLEEIIYFEILFFSSDIMNVADAIPQ